MYATMRPGSLQPNESGRNSSAFIYFRHCYGPDPVLGKNWSRSVPVMLRFATVYSRCSSGGATVCPRAFRYTTVLLRESAAKPRWTRLYRVRIVTLHCYISASMYFKECEYSRTIFPLSYNLSYYSLCVMRTFPFSQIIDLLQLLNVCEVVLKSCIEQNYCAFIMFWFSGSM